jgi:NADP-dependent 3-hydroxy acid dehydrogenase YdfG
MYLTINFNRLVATNIFNNETANEEVITKTLQKCPNALTPEDVANGILYVLSTPYTVNITELTIRPISEGF